MKRKPLFRAGSKSELIWRLLQQGVARQIIAQRTNSHLKFVEAVWQRGTNPDRRKKEAQIAKRQTMRRRMVLQAA